MAARQLGHATVTLKSLWVAGLLAGSLHAAMVESDSALAAVGSVADVTDATTTVTLQKAVADNRDRRLNGEGRPVYRITVRATGPRNSLAVFKPWLLVDPNGYLP